MLGAEKTLALALSLPESVGRDRATAGALPPSRVPLAKPPVLEAMLSRVYTPRLSVKRN